MARGRKKNKKQVALGRKLWGVKVLSDVWFLELPERKKQSGRKE